MKYMLLFFLILFLSACSPKLRKSFAKVSKPEKTWVFFHLFKAKKAFLVSKNVERIVDSIGKEGIIGKDKSGGELDAFKHSFWMARLTQNIGKRAAYRLGIAHEKGNYRAYKKRRLEDGMLPDKPSSEMDLFNNLVGIRVGSHYKKATKSTIVNKLLDSLQKGKLRILSKDKFGNFLDCKNQIIPLDSLLHRWHTKKCLKPSNIILKYTRY